MFCSKTTEIGKTKPTPWGSGKKPVTTAAKQPDRTENFLTDIDEALSNFDNQISFVDINMQEAAYATFAEAYQGAFTNIWPKIADASITTLLKSVKDTTLKEFHRMKCLLLSKKSKATLVKEHRVVPNQTMS